MSLDLSGARQALTDIFQTRTLRRADGVTTSPCGLSLATPSSARLEEGGDTVQERINYVITLPGDTVVALDHNEIVTIDEEAGRVFRITGAPPASNLRLSRRYMATEVR